MQPSLAAVPDAVLEALFSSCDYAELFACSHVCTPWRRHTARSSLWRRVAQQDFARARNTEYQVVAIPVQKRAAVSSSFNTASLFTFEVRMRQRSRDDDDETTAAAGGASAGRYGGVPSYAQGLHVYSFGGVFGAPTSTSQYHHNSSRSSGGGGADALQRRSSSTCFSSLGSSAEVREVCGRYIEPLGFTAGHGAASALRREKARLATAHASTSTYVDAEADHPLPLWEDGSILRDGVLLCDPHDPGTFCFYAATLQRPWCTVVMDRFLVDDALLRRLARYRAGGDGAAAPSSPSCCLDLAFRVEELPVVRNDPRHPVHTVTPAQPVALRIGVLERAQLPAYQRGLRHILADMVCYAATPSAESGEEGEDDHDKSGGDKRAAPAPSAADPSAYAWGALDAAPEARDGTARPRTRTRSTRRQRCRRGSRQACRKPCKPRASPRAQRTAAAVLGRRLLCGPVGDSALTHTATPPGSAPAPTRAPLRTAHTAQPSRLATPPPATATTRRATTSARTSPIRWGRRWPKETWCICSSGAMRTSSLWPATGSGSAPSSRTPSQTSSTGASPSRCRTVVSASSRHV